MTNLNFQESDFINLIVITHEERHRDLAAGEKRLTGLELERG